MLPQPRAWLISTPEHSTMVMHLALFLIVGASGATQRRLDTAAQVRSPIWPATFRPALPLAALSRPGSLSVSLSAHLPTRLWSPPRPLACALALSGPLWGRTNVF